MLHPSPVPASDIAQTLYSPAPLAGLVGLGTIGLLGAAVVGGTAYLLLDTVGVAGPVATSYFTTVASIIPLLALGLVLEFATSMSSAFRTLYLTLQRIEQSLLTRFPEHEQLIQEIVRSHMRVTVAPIIWAVAFAAGLAVQFVIAEGVALSCVAASSTSLLLALMIGALLAVLFVELLIFRAVLAARGDREPTDAEIDELINEFPDTKPSKHDESDAADQP